MIDENTLTQYYAAIAQKLDELIPCEWEKVALYAEETEYTRMALFYFYTEDGNYHYCENIWEKYGVDEKEYDRLMQELENINVSLWLVFKESGEEPWHSFTFTLDKDGKFNMKFSYVNSEDEGVDAMQTKIRWAYDELGILPPGTYGKKLLKKYLLSRERELPEELKDI
ncbi:MAG: antitoxin YezG family protein [Acetatifactor muris]|nr:antitoxin YezG family protein [Acetatifactor muris]MCM1526609.1 antitoxin YezG family protein [Bacteroides sp.]